MCTPRDWARLGQLYLQKGLAAEGEQLIPRSWVTASAFEDQLQEGDFSSNCLSSGFGRYYGYGYQWFIDKTVQDDAKIRPEFEGSFTANGLYGQQIVVLPRINTVIAILADDPTLVL